MKILGLDISTSTVGICVIDFDAKGKVKLVYIDYYKPIKKILDDKNEDFLHMLSEAKTYILEIIQKYQPDHIAVEDFIRFLGGGSGAGTIIPLAILNKTICLSIYENYLDTPLHICNVISIRTRIKKDLGRIELPPKEEIPEILEKMLKITIPRPMKKTRKGEKIDEPHWDMADSIAVAYYCFRKLQENK